MKFVCPYCVNDLNKNDIVYECRDCGPISKADIRWFNKLVDNQIKCGKCGKHATVERCSHCGAELPHVMIHTPNLMFSIVGVSGAGKTNFITVMLEELKNTRQLRLSLSYQNNETRDIHKRNRELIYDRNEKVESTAAGTVTPQIWQIRNLNRIRGNNIDAYTLNIFDGAGEDHENMDPTVCRYIAKSEAIMFVFDPMILQTVKKTLDPDTYRKSVAGDTSYKDSRDVVNSMADYIRQTTPGMSVRRIIDVPVAVIFTKMDALMDGFRNRPVAQESPHDKAGRFMWSDARAVDADIRAWLQSRGESGFIDALRGNFKEFVFFGVSSFGSVPLTTDKLRPVHPHRVLDPLLWLLAKKNFIDSE